jgi:hypothetical protein
MSKHVKAEVAERTPGAHVQQEVVAILGQVLYVLRPVFSLALVLVILYMTYQAFMLLVTLYYKSIVCPWIPLDVLRRHMGCFELSSAPAARINEIVQRSISIAEDLMTAKLPAAVIVYKGKLALDDLGLAILYSDIGQKRVLYDKIQAFSEMTHVLVDQLAALDARLSM